MADLPWTSFINNWSGYRYIDRELVSRLKYGGSVDWGMHLLRATGDRGQLQYATSLASGSSYKRPRTGDSPDSEGRVAGQPSQYTVLAVGAYAVKRALDGGDHVTWHRARRRDAMAAHADKRFRFGGQYFRAIDWNEVRLVRGDRASGWSVWGSVKLSLQWAVFARHDQANTSERLDPTRHDRYDNLGLEWNISKQVQVAAAYKHERIGHLDKAFSAFNELGLWAQIDF